MVCFWIGSSKCRALAHVHEEREEASSAECRAQGALPVLRPEWKSRRELRRGCPSLRSVPVLLTQQCVQEMINLSKGPHYHTGRFARLGFFAFHPFPVVDSNWGAGFSFIDWATGSQGLEVILCLKCSTSTNAQSIIIVLRLQDDSLKSWKFCLTLL